MKPVRILHYVPGFEFGGIESRLLDWYNNIDRTKVEFDVLIQTDLDNEIIRDIKNLGGNIYKISKFSPKTLFGFLRDVSNFFAVHDDYNAVHCHSLTTGYFIMKEAKRRNVSKLILHSRTSSFSGEKTSAIKKIFKKLSVSIATDYFACSKEAGEFMLKNTRFKKKPVTVIKNAIEADKFVFNLNKRTEIREQLNSSDSFVVGHIGRLTSAKNHMFLLDTFFEIYQQNRNSKLLLIGDGPLKNDIIKKAKQLGLIENVLLLGYKENIHDYLQAMDVFVFPSHYEGFGTVAVEAQASGLYCVVSDGVPKAVDVTHLVEHLPLSAGPPKWADRILNYHNGYKRKNMYEQIVEAGFDARSTAKWLEKFYLGFRN